MTTKLAPFLSTSFAVLALAACGDDGGSADDSTSTTTATEISDSQAEASETDVSATETDASATETDASATESDASDTQETTEGSADGGEYSGVLEGWCDSQGGDFSFFVTSMEALWTLHGDPVSNLNGGFGGDFGGIVGADAICQEIASATGHGDKTWHAFLSATNDGSGNPVNAIERIGQGPWSDANNRLVASSLAGLAGERPDGDPQSTEDLPDECGVPISFLGDAHDVPTGSNKQGMLNSTDPDSTCNDWTSNDGSVGGDGSFEGGTVMCGHTFPREGGGGGPEGANWVSDHQLRGCTPGANLLQNGAGEGTCIGCTGGYGALYCFAID